MFDYNIFLIGFMGAGKSTVAADLKNKLQMERLEMDEMIVKKQGMSIPEIFEKYGEDYFRDLESHLLVEIQKEKQAIVSCGGGAVIKDENVQTMKENGYIVLLTAEPETIYERVKDNTDRPILNNNMNVEFIAELMAKRKERYLSVADVIVATDEKNVGEICEEIVEKLKGMESV